MQKKIIALAVAGLVSGAAFAQSNVTVYGFADVAYEYNDGDDRTFSGLSDGGWSQSRIGFKGEEALGNGLKAIFQMEYAAGIDENQKLSNVRQSFVGLSTQYGSFTAGRQYAPSFMQMGRNSANEITNVNPMNVFYGTFSSMGTGEGSRWNNSVVYQSANFSGFSTRLIYSFGEKVGVDASTTDAQKFGASLNYANGPFNADFIYQAQDDDSSTAVTTKGYDSYYLGGGYDFKAVKVVASYQKETNDNTKLDPTLWSIGAIIPVSAAGKVRVEYAALDADYKDGEAQGFGIGYTHDLSKRTVVYTYLSQIDNDDLIAKGRNGTATLGEKNTNFIVGMRHAF